LKQRKPFPHDIILPGLSRETTKLMKCVLPFIKILIPPQS